MQICTVPFVFLFRFIFIFCNVVLIDFVRGTLRPSLQHVEDSRLKALIQDLHAVLFTSKTVNTTKKYERGFNAWRK